MQSTDVVWHQATVTRSRRETLNGDRGAVLWFTGLPSSGKSTIAHLVEENLHQARCRTMVLDGDNVRHGLCGDLGFSAADRHENIRRVGEVAKLFVDAGVILLTAFVSPIRADRERVRGLLQCWRLSGNPHPVPGCNLRNARPQGPLPPRPCWRDQGFHRRIGAL